MTTNVINFDLAHDRKRSAPRDRDHLKMNSCSILFDEAVGRTFDEDVEAPAFFTDLNCGQIVDTIVSGKEEYNIKPFFYRCLDRRDAIEYRHRVMQDLEDEHTLESVRSFSNKMQEMRRYLTRVQKLFYKEQKQAWFLDAIESYCKLVKEFASALAASGLKSRGMLKFREFLSAYVSSPDFGRLLSESQRLKTSLAQLQYSIIINGDRLVVRRYDGEPDYSAEVEETFAKFKQGAVKSYQVKFSESDDMNHIEAKVLEFVARLNPGIFGELDQYYAQSSNFLDDTIKNFDREIQFYLSYMDYIHPLKSKGLPFSYPTLLDADKAIRCAEGFDVALAYKLLKESSPVVRNDFYLKGKERILVVSGPNQGGKTTFARMFGQLHYLASIGLPVPAKEARLFLFDNMFTHFEKQEKVENLRGKLEDDLIRVHEIVDHATASSIVILNEIFTSTTIQDEVFLSRKLLDRMIALDVLAVWVTFADELASFGPQTVSMMSTVVPDNPALRTFKIERRPADGLAYALAIANKYRVTYESIRERLQS